MMLGRRAGARREGVPPTCQQHDGPVWEAKRASAAMIALPLCLGFVLGACALIFSAGPTQQQVVTPQHQLLYLSNSTGHEALSTKLLEATAGLMAAKRAIVSLEAQLRESRGAACAGAAVVSPTADYALYSLWGNLEQDPPRTQTALLAMAVGAHMRENVDAIVSKFNPATYRILLFHYDGLVEPWRELPWYRDAIAIVALRQTKWWYMKRFLHPDIVAPYDYIFLWDEDIGTEGFSPDKLLQVAREEKLQIFQPAVDAGPVSWPITRKVDGLKLHRTSRDTRCRKDREGRGADQQPPCGNHIEIMVPVLSRAAWACVWNILPADLIHGWGLDLAWHRCASVGGVTLKGQGMAIVDTVAVQHLTHPSLSDQVPVDSDGGQASGERVSARQRNEWSQFDARWGREKELQHETDMEFFRATRDGTALPGTAAAAEEEDAGVGAAGGAMMIRGGGAAAAVAAVAALLRDGWAEPEVPLVAQPPPAAMQATPASASVHRL